MVIFIFESIGTSELILVGIVALIFLGPRRLPELARKAGKIMAEFRGTATEFKQTWEREVNFEEEAKSLSLSNLDDEVARRKPKLDSPATTTVIAEPPAIRAVDAENFKHLIPTSDGSTRELPTEDNSSASDKQNWL